MSSMITKKEVHAPFDGQLGIRQVNVGQNINAGQQVVPLTALDPLYVDFALPQQDIETFQDWKSACTPTRCPAKNSKASLLRLTRWSTSTHGT